jgi:hypothetical protein
MNAPSGTFDPSDSFRHPRAAPVRPLREHQMFAFLRNIGIRDYHCSNEKYNVCFGTVFGSSGSCLLYDLRRHYIPTGWPSLHPKMHPQLNEIIVFNFPPLQGEDKGGMGSPSNFHPPLSRQAVMRVSTDPHPQIMDRSEDYPLNCS